MHQPTKSKNAPLVYKIIPTSIYLEHWQSKIKHQLRTQSSTNSLITHYLSLGIGVAKERLQRSEKTTCTKTGIAAQYPTFVNWLDDLP
ncbi:MAG TPA: hypothetical protein DIW64_20230 [Cellvibrio sp.]|nr:hypothetical protein [Cellvibrio sp.]